MFKLRSSRIIAATVSGNREEGIRREGMLERFWGRWRRWDRYDCDIREVEDRTLSSFVKFVGIF